jgi:histidinol-phosphate aminotransferase
MGYFRENIEKMAGYTPGEQLGDLGYIKLNTNENPYPPSPRVIEAIKKEATSLIRLYPNPLADPLRETASKVYNLDTENIMVGNGSDDLLSIICRAFIGKDDGIIIPIPTYTLYDTLVTIQEGIIKKVPFNEDFSLPAEIFSVKGKLIFLANPNSPSGTFINIKDIEKIAETFNGMIIIDEAYGDFAPESAVSLINRYDNIVVLKSFSKSFSLAGLRIGLAFASKEIINGMMKVKDSYNINRISMAAGIAALEDIEWMKMNVEKIKRTRERLRGSLMDLGFYVYPSHTNFVLAKIKGRSLKDLYLSLKDKKILIRYFDNPILYDSIRITIGRDDEIDILIKEIKEWVYANIKKD